MYFSISLLRNFVHIKKRFGHIIS